MDIDRCNSRIVHSVGNYLPHIHSVIRSGSRGTGMTLQRQRPNKNDLSIETPVYAGVSGERFFDIPEYVE
ncbi:hypothetical protein D3C74_448910 [compost metagenome]